MLTQNKVAHLQNPIQIGKGGAGLPFGDRLPGDIELPGQFLLGPAAALAQQRDLSAKINFNHPFRFPSPVPPGLFLAGSPVDNHQARCILCHLTVAFSLFPCFSIAVTVFRT